MQADQSVASHFAPNLFLSTQFFTIRLNTEPLQRNRGVIMGKSYRSPQTTHFSRGSATPPIYYQLPFQERITYAFLQGEIQLHRDLPVLLRE